MIWQGEVVTDHPVEGFHIYQEILSLNHIPYAPEAHLALLKSSSEALFGNSTTLTSSDIRRHIATLLAKNKPSRRGSVRIVLTLDAQGRYSLRNDDASIYDSYVVRSLHPKATYVDIETPQPLHPSSAMAHTHELAEIMARGKGFDKAVICRGERIVADIARPLIALGGRTLLTHPSTRESVEGRRLIEAAQSRGYTIRTREVTKADLAKAEEVMILDWQGVQPLASLEQRAYLQIAIEQLIKEVVNRLKP